MDGLEFGLSRRQLFQRAAGGFASIALAGILDDRQASRASSAMTATDPLAPKQPHFAPGPSESSSSI